MIDINKLRRKLHSDDLIDHVDIHANVKPILTELLDRLEDAESDALEQARLNGMGASREASLMAKLAAAETAWKVSDKSLYDLTEKVIPNLRDQLETAEKDIALKERIIDSLGAELNAVAKERDALRARIEAMEKQDPAAWQRQHRSFGPDAWVESAGSVAERLKTEDGWKVRPLYLAPGAQAAVPDGWQPIETAPKDTFLLLRGPSGYTTTPFAYTTGRMCSAYKVGRWIDHRNDDLTDWGFEPTHWMPLPEER